MQHLPHFTLSRAPVTGNLSTCRSCNKSIAAGEVRVKIEYKTKLVQYATRSGSPSFYVHLDCLLQNPVDYAKTGVNAWKSWEPCSNFDIETITVSKADETLVESVGKLKSYTDAQ